MAVVVALVLSSHPSLQVHAAAGDLDPTFGASGKVITNFFGPSEEAFNIAIQSDGKIVTVGYAFNLLTAYDFALARYNPDGSLDESFGAGGKVATDFGNNSDFAHGVALQKDGKIVVTGSNGVVFELARYRVDGSLDPTFGAGGRVTTDFFQFGADSYKVAIQADGKIVVTGNAVKPGEGSLFILVRYNTDGSLDPTFGLGGKAINNFSDPRGFDVALEQPFALGIQPDGKILTGGYTLGFPTGYEFIVVRHNTDGSLDSTFGFGGRTLTDFNRSFDFAYGLTIQPDGKILLVGEAYNFSFNYDFALARYKSDGTLDPSFGNGGKVTTDFAGNIDRAFQVAVQTNGKIVVAGNSYSGANNYDFALARYNPNGTLDVGFGIGGKVKTDFFGQLDEANALAIQRDGKIVAVGRDSTALDGFDFALIRYEGDTVFDICLQDDSSGSFLQFNSTTGEYVFTNCRGLTLGGTGSLTKKGSLITLQQNGPDRRLLAQIDRSVNRGSATLQVFSPGSTFTIIDRNTLNDTCSCPTPP
jgi:uncharacterized delta-60 repeat protein